MSLQVVYNACHVGVLRDSAAMVEVTVDCRENFGDPTPWVQLFEAAPEMAKLRREPLEWNTASQYEMWLARVRNVLRVLHP